MAITGRESMWLVADRRLSARGKVVRDDARKIMILESVDGISILAYAGLGATPKGTEPADWMSAVLRGRHMPIEQSLGTIAAVAQKQLPKHMIRAGGALPAHVIIAPAFVDEESRLYVIEVARSANGFSYELQFRRQVAADGVLRPPRVAAGGSGAICVRMKPLRPILRLIKANDHKRVSELAVADALAGLNHEVHQETADGSVGPRCIVVWRYRRGGLHAGGGGQQSYTATTRDVDNGGVPTVASGLDVMALIGAIMPLTMKKMERMMAGESVDDAMDEDAINAELALLPDTPDEELR